VLFRPLIEHSQFGAYITQNGVYMKAPNLSNALFSNVQQRVLALIFGHPDAQPLSPLVWRMLLQDIVRKLHDNRWSGLPSTIESQVSAPLLADGASPTSIKFKAKVRRITERVELASVVAYVDPISTESQAAAAKYQLGETEIIENCDQTAMVMDLVS
jgi:hypothetical protein